MVTADDVKRAVPMRRLVERYGFEPNHGGYICCPFHHEDTPSLKVYDGDRGWHCFGCGEGGDQITFVRMLYGLDFRQAMLRIMNDFGLADTPGTPRPVQKPKRDDTKDQWREGNLAILHRSLLQVLGRPECERYRELAADGQWDEVPEWYLDAATDFEWVTAQLRELDERKSISRYLRRERDGRQTGPGS